MSKLFSLVILLLGTFVATAQQSPCPNNLIANGDLETGTPTGSHQDIGNAAGFSRIWAPGSWADYYNATSGPFSQPALPSGNYVSCWISTSSNVAFREGFQFELDITLPPNTGTYTLTFESACLNHSWGTVDVGVYGLHNPTGGDAPNPPTSSTAPTNIGLFGAANTILLGTFAEDAISCTNNKTTRTITINTNLAGYPAGGITHVFITRADGSPSGGIYAGFDNFCLTAPDSVCPGNYFTNGDAEDGTPTASHQDIDNAVGYSRIWATGSLADYYAATAGPFAPTVPMPMSGDYISCWIANYNGGGTTYREGFENQLVATILPNTGMYELTFETACLSGWGNSEIGVYGVDNPSNANPTTPTGAFTPSNMTLFPAGTTVFIDAIPITSTSCSSTKTPRTVYIDSDAPGFPAGGISHVFITHSDNTALNGALYMGFDDFCLHSYDSVVVHPTPCPNMGDYEARCIEDTNGDGIPDYEVTIVVADDAAGSITFFTSCGTISPNPLVLNGSGTYTLVVTSNGSCSPFNVSYSITDADGVACDQGEVDWELPPCKNPCPCDKFFADNVNAGFNYVEDCPNDFFTPLALVDPCDRVEWYVNGSYVGSSVGNATFSMPHINGSYTICMTVTRNDAVNQVACRETFCREINPDLICRDQVGPAFRLQVQPNPATQQAVVSWSTEDAPDDLNIDVYNAQGVRVLSITAVNGHDGRINLDLTNLAEGIYYIHATGEGYEAAPIKLIKQ